MQSGTRIFAPFIFSRMNDMKSCRLQPHRLRRLRRRRLRRPLLHRQHRHAAERPIRLRGAVGRVLRVPGVLVAL